MKGRTGSEINEETTSEFMEELIRTRAGFRARNEDTDLRLLGIPRLN